MNNTLNSQMLQCECPLLGVERTLDEVAGFIAVTRMTHSGHRLGRNLALQRPSCRHAMFKRPGGQPRLIQKISGLPQGPARPADVRLNLPWSAPREEVACST
jgi:hypothetical protein